MLRTCLSCYRPFPENSTLEHFTAGRRVAFDPHRGRLWAVCPSCARWTLAPFESRWEALEELERVTRDRARLLAETDRIGLLHAGDVEIVRVGRANLREESWWRYGREFSARRKGARRTALKGKVFDALFIMLVSGIPFWGLSDGRHWVARARRKRFGREAWEGRSTCRRCGAELNELWFSDYRDLRIVRDESGRPAIGFGCPRCHGLEDDPGHLVRGVTAEHLLRRTLAYANFAGGSQDSVTAAMSLVESYPSTGALIGRVAERGFSVGHLTEKGALALEIALNEDVEHRLLEMELAELEARWREEEAIAAIADRL